MTQLASIITLIAAWKPLGLAAIFFGLLLEGEVVIFTAFFLAHRGALDLGDVILVIIAGVALNDLLWHKLGMMLSDHEKKIGFFSNWRQRLEKIAAPLDRLLIVSPRRTLFAIKFAYGLMRPTLLRTGMIGIPTNQFIKYDYPAAILWLTIVGGLGYFSSLSLELLRHYFRMAEISFVAILVSFFILWHIIIKRFIGLKEIAK